MQTTTQLRQSGVRWLGCTGGCLAFLVALLPLGLIGALAMAASDCTFGCDETRADQLALVLLICAVLAVAGAVVGAVGAWLSRSKLALATVLLALSTGLVTLAGAALFIDGLVAPFEGATAISVWFLVPVLILGVACWKTFHKSRTVMTAEANHEANN